MKKEVWAPRTVITSIEARTTKVKSLSKQILGLKSENRYLAACKLARLRYNLWESQMFSSSSLTTIRSLSINPWLSAIVKFWIAIKAYCTRLHRIKMIDNPAIVAQSAAFRSTQKLWPMSPLQLLTVRVNLNSLTLGLRSLTKQCCYLLIQAIRPATSLNCSTTQEDSSRQWLQHMIGGVKSKISTSKSILVRDPRLVKRET